MSAPALLFPSTHAAAARRIVPSYWLVSLARLSTGPVFLGAGRVRARRPAPARPAPIMDGVGQLMVRRRKAKPHPDAPFGGAPAPAELTEEQIDQLVLRMEAGDEKALAALYRAFSPRARAFARKALDERWWVFERDDEEHVLDTVVNDLFLKLWSDALRGKLTIVRAERRPEHRFGSYVWLIVRASVRAAVRKRGIMLRNRRKHAETLTREDRIDSRPSPLEECVSCDEARRGNVARAIARLTPGCRDAVALRMEGYTNVEAAAMLGRPEGSVRVSVHTARAALKRDEEIAPLFRKTTANGIRVVSKMGNADMEALGPAISEVIRRCLIANPMEKLRVMQEAVEREVGVSFATKSTRFREAYVTPVREDLGLASPKVGDVTRDEAALCRQTIRENIHLSNGELRELVYQRTGRLIRTNLADFVHFYVNPIRRELGLTFCSRRQAFVSCAAVTFAKDSAEEVRA